MEETIDFQINRFLENEEENSIYNFLYEDKYCCIYPTNTIIIQELSTFPTTIKKSKGRKKNEDKKKLNLLSSKRYHGNKDKDNIIRKIKNHFKKFIISLLNSIVHNKFKRQKVRFRLFKHNGSDILSMREFMNLTIKQVCKLPISDNYTNFSENQNEKSFYEICDNNIINLTLKEIYTNYYLSNNLYPYNFCENDEKNKKKKIKSFNDLINDPKNAMDEELQKKIKKYGITLVSDYINQESKSNKIKNKQLDDENNGIFYQE